jgi:NAD(P)-dependent dehydrogenase (short-subunit alcohol dehydrogenase family)
VVTVVDVSNFDAVAAAVSETVTELGRLDVLVNSAGVEKRAPFLEDHFPGLATPTGCKAAARARSSGRPSTRSVRNCPPTLFDAST